MFGDVALAVLSSFGRRWTHPERWLHLSFRCLWTYQFKSYNRVVVPCLMFVHLQPIPYAEYLPFLRTYGNKASLSAHALKCSDLVRSQSLDFSLQHSENFLNSPMFYPSSWPRHVHIAHDTNPVVWHTILFNFASGPVLINYVLCLCACKRHCFTYDFCSHKFVR